MSWMNEDDPRPPTRALSEAECWERLGAARIGRVVTTAAGEVDIFPVNHAVEQRTVVFRTAPGTKLLELTVHQDVVFEVDGYDGVEAYSVVVKGQAQELQTSREIAEADRLDIRPWAPEVKDRWVRITPARVDGRSFVLA